MRRLITPVTLVTAVVFLTPGHAIGYAIYSVSHYNDYNARIQAELQNSLQHPETSGLKEGLEPKNLIVIYAESLEQTYFDKELFGDVMPELRALREDALSFTDIQQYPGTSWTVAGIVSSQCGLPLISRTPANQILASFDDPFRDITCFAEFLKEQGYATFYMGGSSLEFAGKGTFLQKNGFDVTMGHEAYPDFFPQSGWGIYDAKLFEEDSNIRNSLAESQAPYLLTFLTLDTHHPYGHPSAECRTSAGMEKDILGAVSCSDQLIAKFIKDTLAGPEGENTVIAVVSDHLAMRNSATDTLKKGDRKLLFL
ncbi:phosphoglycerol transferase I [Roseovarius albus]|uniref:Phosphoglycerol transferase I n=1 Tax=Roseovarius albus TaxID=1247867 RepID=A0A1X6ZYU6_9RHOB|nr:sulfatase-like hydrolase/transferase [Roseovarius albus]SLN65633.1 phosphoglycerol transferase I [Roseovarius albus]